MPPNVITPSGANRVNAKDVEDVPWWESGPFWVLVFLIVGYILVYRTIK